MIKKSIGYVVPTDRIAGGIIVILEHCNRLKKRGHNTFLINIMEGTDVSWYPYNTVPVYSLKGNYPPKCDILIATGWQTAYLTSQIDIDVKRYLYFVQSDESRFYPEKNLEGLLAYNTYFLPYEYFTEARWIKQWLAVSFGWDAVYAPNALNKDIIHKTDPLAPKTDKLRILLEGPFDVPFKGMNDSLRAVEGLDAEIWCVTSSGNPPKSCMINRLFRNIPFNEMKYIYSSCDILLKMSKVEGFFGPPLEMMACGGTAVTTRVTGFDEYIVDGFNAMTVEIGDYNAAHEKLKILINDRELLNRLRINGEKTANNMEWESTIDVLEEFFSRKFSSQFIFNSQFEKQSAYTMGLFTEKLVIDYTQNKLENVLMCLERTDENLLLFSVINKIRSIKILKFLIDKIIVPIVKKYYNPT